MSSVTFNANWLIAQATASVEYLDFGFPPASKVMNNETTTSTISGKSQKVYAHYHGNSLPPKAFTVSKEIKFPEDAHITINGGGPNDNVVELIDTKGNRAVFIIVSI